MGSKKKTECFCLEKKHQGPRTSKKSYAPTSSPTYVVGFLFLFVLALLVMTDAHCDIAHLAETPFGFCTSAFLPGDRGSKPAAVRRGAPQHPGPGRCWRAFQAIAERKRAAPVCK
jgi:hypothetical protein